jgi:hypothetical protein
MIAVPMIVAAFGFAACGDDDDEAATTEEPAATTAAGGAPGASVEFISPKDGSSTKDSPQSDVVRAKVKLTNFTINADAVGKAAVEGEGHLHFSMDTGKYDTAKYSGANGELAEMLGTDGKYSPSTTPTITYSGLPPGEHTLAVDLANNDHTETGVSAETTFTVE